MAARYWVGGTATWDGTAGSKWALTSGGAGGQAVPTSADTVFFDANSGANTVTIGSGTAVCLTLTLTGFTGTLAFGTNSITVSGTNTTIFTGATTCTVTGTPLLICNGAGTSGQTRIINTTSMAETNLISFNITAGVDIVSFTTSRTKTINFTGFTGSLVATSHTIYGDLVLSSGMTVTASATVLTFSSTLVQQNITTNGTLLDRPLTFSGTNTYQLQDALTTSSARTLTLTTGTLDLNNKTLTTGLFSSSNSNTRTLAFGVSGSLNVGGTGTVIGCLTYTGLTITGSSNVNVTSTGSTAITIQTPNVTNPFNYAFTGGTYALTFSVNFLVGGLNFTGYAGTLGNAALAIGGSVVISTGMTLTAGTNAWTIAGLTQQNITTNGKTLDFPINFGSGSSTNTVQLQDAMTLGSTRAALLNSGTLDLNNKVLTAGSFSSSNTNTRSILFGTGNITLATNNGTILAGATLTGFTYTGTPTINATYSGATGTRTFNWGNTAGGSETNAVSINISAGTDIVALSTVFLNLDFTGFAGTYSNNTKNIYGNLVISTGMTLTAGTLAQSFSGTLTQQNITTNGKTLDFPLTFSGTNTYQLQDAMTVGSTRIITLTTGTLDMNSKTLNCGFFASSNNNSRTLAFGTATLYVNGSGANTFVSNGTPAMLATGNRVVIATYSGSVGTRTFTTGAVLETSAVDLYITGGTDTVTPNGNFRTIDFTGFAGTLTNIGRSLYGNLVLSTGMTITAGATGTTFAGTLSQQNITSNGKTMDFPIALNGTNTYQLQDALTIGSTRTLNLTTGTLDLNGKVLTCGIFASGNSNVRALNANLGSIYVTGNAAAIFTVSPETNMTATSVIPIYFTYSGATGTRQLNGSGVGGTVLFDAYFNAGSDTVQISNYFCRNINFTGFTGTFNNQSTNLQGNVIFSSGMATAQVSGTFNVASNTATQQITSNGVTLNFPVSIYGTTSGGLQLQDNLTVATTQSITLTQRTLDLNTHNLSCGSISTSGTLTRTIALGTNTLTLTGSGTVFDATTPTGLTVTGTGTISTNSASAKTFIGGSITYPTLSQDGAGTLTITGSNTFANITNTVQPTTITFTAGTTTTVSNFNVNGTSGNLVTLNSSTPGTQATLTKSGGGTVTSNYLSIQDSNATPASTWNANNSTNVSNNTGWNFGAVVVTVVNALFFGAFF